MDRRRFSTLAHKNHEFASPVCYGKALDLFSEAGVAEGTRVLDIGCGFGSWSHMAKDEGAKVVAIDDNPEFMLRARDWPSDIEWIEAPYEPTLVAPQSQDVVLCIGSSQAIGSLDDALKEIERVLVPGGAAVIGEGFWAQPPTQDYLDLLGSEPDDMKSLPDLADHIQSLGWSIRYLSTSSTDDWERYEVRYRSTMVAWLRANPTDPEHDAFLRRSDLWFDGFIRWGRSTLGFVFLVLDRA